MWRHMGVSVLRTQTLVGKNHHPERIKNMKDVILGIEEWERNIVLYKTATKEDISDNIKLFSLRQLLPKVLEDAINTQSNHLKKYEEIKDYIITQVSLYEEKHGKGTSNLNSLEGSDVDALYKLLTEEQEWPEES